MPWYLIVILIILGVVILSVIFWHLLARYFFNKTILRKENQITIEEADKMMGTHWGQFTELMSERKKWFDAQSFETVSIQSDDGLKLVGHYLESDPSSKKIVIAFHGYSSKGMSDHCATANLYYRLGINTLIVDERAHGESEGKYVGFGVLDRYDALKWIEYVINRFGSDCKIILHGISMGGATVLMTAGLNPPKNVKAIIADCAFTSAYDVFSHVLKTWYHIPSGPILKITEKMGRKEAGYGYKDCSTLDAVAKTDIPILFIHGGKDTFVPTWMSRENYKTCASPKELVIVENAAHGESFFMDNAKCEKAISDFIGKYC